ncbi:MAG: hypothetical protein A3B92_02845 [Candidatus Harrisonbacteria bacterium RIFCSPHIGHO2_02_FULL_42_16]|uniref:Large ribosomal subunit protein uL15 n=1 Tax=Candidatus Harrisonbacteria bacterium RIFCSPHIGHO2_02_FULL_42_16 TaxID=1798404 RepID=A0A1G1ZIM1_9BACT|nr:MAG: hypothetical protein A3B92_02845 [Candidatus Harrisonbacteria bacterium RIFCSPHIGHO2_02_FULL_42_16]
MDLFKNSKQKGKKSKRVGRGGKRGTTSGRGTKGQKSRAGHRIRPAERDLLIRIPKLRGFRNKSIQKKLGIINVGDLNKMAETAFTKNNLGNIKILGSGELNKSITITGLPASKSARQKIEKAGGKIQ